MDEAGDAYLEASSHLNALIDKFPLSAEYQQQLSTTFNVLGIIFAATGQPTKAETAYRDALGVLDQMSTEQADRPGHRDAVARICHNLGLLLGIGQPAESEDFLRRGQTAFSKLQKEFPTNPTYQHALAASYTALGNLLMETGRAQKAGAQFRQALVRRELLANKFQRNAALQNSLAWLLVSCPDTRIRDPVRALEYAQKAVKLSAQSHGFWNTLGVAQYRTENWKDAIKALDQAQSLSSGGESASWFFLAMSHWQLGDKEMACNCYDQACEWMEKNKPNDIELLRFRAEAATLLEIEGKMPRGLTPSPR